MIRIGVLGGYFGAEFARAVKEMKGIQLAAVYSPGKSSERLSSELGCPRASSVNEIMENADIDAVIIATPNYLHHQHVLAAAEAGKHIFCEKPFALDAGEAAEMVEACRKAKVTLMVGHIMLEKDAGEIRRPSVSPYSRDRYYAVDYGSTHGNVRGRW